MSRVVFLLGILFFFSHCTSPIVPDETTDYETSIRQTAEDYFSTFSQREDWDKLLSFYRKDLQFHDIALHIELDSLWQFERFYNWPDTGFHKLSPEQEHLVIESIIVQDSTAVARGHLNPFYYYGELVDSDWGMEFTIWLYFDQNKKIKRQIDWFEYDPKVVESVLARYKKQGVDQLPDWLNLER